LGFLPALTPQVDFPYVLPTEVWDAVKSVALLHQAVDRCDPKVSQGVLRTPCEWQIRQFAPPFPLIAGLSENRDFILQYSRFPDL